MSDKEAVLGRRHKHSGVPAAWVVFWMELQELWVGGKALVLMVVFCILQGGLTYFMIDDFDPTPPKEMVYFTLETAIAVGLFMSLIIAADSVSGERERLTLEGLLLTPPSRRQLVLGKFLAACSPWPVALVITVPYLAVLSQGDEVFWPAIFWGAIMGTLLATAFAGLGLVLSIWSNSNKTSLFVSLVIYLAFLIPTQLPGGAQAGGMGRLFKRVNPMESNGHFLEKVLVNNRTFAEFWPWLWSPVVFAILVFALLFLIASPMLRLEVRWKKSWLLGGVA